MFQQVLADNRKGVLDALDAVMSSLPGAKEIEPDEGGKSFLLPSPVLNRFNLLGTELGGFREYVDRLQPAPDNRFGQVREVLGHNHRIFVANNYTQVPKELRTSFDAIPVALLQFVPSGQQLHPTVRGLSGLDTTGWDGPTYADIARFFDEERLRYTGHAGSALQLSVRGPWAETPQPPELQPDAGLARATLAAMLYQRYWRRLGSLRGVDKKAFPLRLFVIFTAEEGDQAAESRAALGGHVAVTYISLDDPNPVYPAITLAHELAHLLGATDKYDEQGFSVYPEGYVEPYDEPIYPQRYAELMSVDIPISLDLEREPQGLHQLRLGYRSAAEMGWIAADVADAFYRAPDLTPDQLLERGEAEEEAPDPEPAPPLSADLEAGEAAVDQGG